MNGLARARILSGVLLLGVLLPIVLFLPYIGRWDHDQMVTLHALARWNLFGFGPVKQWNPLLCGGVSLAADPQVPVLSPTALLGYALGPLLGVRVGLLLLVALGFAGARRLGRVWFEDECVASLFAALFVSNGYFAARFAVGHIPHATHLLVPGILWGLHSVLRAITAASSFWNRIGTGAVGVAGLGLALAFAMDGAHAFLLYAAPLVATYAALLAVQRRSFLPILLTGAAFAWGAACDAVFLLPAAAEYVASPVVRSATSASVVSLAWNLVVPTWTSVVSERWEAHEYTVYVGPVLVALVLCHHRTVRAQLPRRLRRPLLLLSALGLVLGLGAAWPVLDDAVPTPFDALRHLPGLGAVRAPSRFWFWLVLPLAAVGAVALRHELTQRTARACVVGALVVASLASYSFAWAHRSFADAPWLGGLGLGVGATAAASGTDVRFVPGHRARMLADLDVDTGVLRCYWPGTLDGAAFHRPGPLHVLAVTRPDGPEISEREISDRELSGWELSGWKLSGWKASARFVGWNRIVVRAGRLPSATATSIPTGEIRLVLDHNYHRHWHATGGEVSRSETGHLQISLPIDDNAAPDEVSLAFRDPWSVAGGRVSAIALALSALVLAGGWAGRRRTRRQSRR